MQLIIRKELFFSVEIRNIENDFRFFFLVPIFGMLSSYVAVGIRSYISKICNRNEESQIFSIIASIESIDALIGSILFHIIYSYTINLYSNLIFILACCLHFFTLPIFM
jgi:MFS-type transporter involved in bile tolerance (Atg22 family)